MIYTFIERKARRLNIWNNTLIQYGSLILIILLVCYGYVSGYNGLDLREIGLIAPCIPHLYGTDPDGRDIFIRVIISIKAYFLPGILAICISIILGTILGIAASSIWQGWCARIIGFFAQCIMDALEAFPKYITLLLMITIIDKPDFYDMMIALGIINSSRIGKIVMGCIEVLQKRHFIEAAEALGIKKIDVILRHILVYNCLPVFITQASLQMAEVILIEIGLSYLGSISQWGWSITPEPMPSLGNIMVLWQSYFSAWWLLVFPLLMAVFNILVFYSIADMINKKVRKGDIEEF
jgi:ABC-type dipeptide/oligopeptide/nickel transport system permease subunit